MKNILVGMLLGVTILLSINAVTTQTANKPAQPKAWVVTTGNANECEKTILTYSKMGYIVHSLQTSGYNANGSSMVVMYKYY